LLYSPDFDKKPRFEAQLKSNEADTGNVIRLMEEATMAEPAELDSGIVGFTACNSPSQYFSLTFC